MLPIAAGDLSSVSLLETVDCVQYPTRGSDGCSQATVQCYVDKSCITASLQS